MPLIASSSSGVVGPPADHLAEGRVGRDGVGGLAVGPLPAPGLQTGAILVVADRPAPPSSAGALLARAALRPGFGGSQSTGSWTVAAATEAERPLPGSPEVGPSSCPPAADAGSSPEA